MRLSSSILIPLAVIVLTIVAALEQLQPPSVVPANADPGVFSAERAMQYVRVITAAPHPVGTIGDRRVREYLVDQLKALGLEVTVQRTTAALVFGQARAVEVYNIIARLPGTASSKAVMVAAHYDAAPDAPGAADDAYAVADMLETVRALKYQPPLKNDLILLITDGEEAGLFGARAFVDEYPLNEEIGVALNYEGRGISGPSLMFETTSNDGWVVREFNTAVRNKIAFSMMVDVYKRLPNNTDFTFLKERIGSGLNFAHIGDVQYYHSTRDDAQHIDLRTAQHHGETMLLAVLHFGNIDLQQTESPDVIYFSFLLPRLVIYPMTWNIPLAILSSVVFVAAFVFAVMRRRIRPWRLLLALLLFLVRLLLAGGVVFLLWKVLGSLLPEFDLFYFQRVYHGSWYLGGFVLLAVVFGWIFHRYAVDKLGVFNVAYGALLWWGIALWGVTLYAPHGSYLLAWPFLFSAVVLTISDWRGDSLESSGLALLLISLFSIPGVYLFVQLIYLLYHGMTLMVAGVFAFLVVFVMGTVQLELDFFSRRRAWIVTVALMLLSAGSVIVALLNRGSTKECPKPDTIAYLLDADSRKAQWVTFDPKLDAWTSQFFEGEKDSSALHGYFPFNTERILVAEAPYAILKNPTVELLENKVSDSIRSTRLRIHSQRDAYKLSIVADTTVEVVGAEVNGKPIVNAVKYIPQLESLLPLRRGPWMLEFYGSGFELRLKTKRGGRISFTVIERSSGIPESAFQKFTPRPDWTMPRPFYPSDGTIVRKTFRF